MALPDKGPVWGNVEVVNMAEGQGGGWTGTLGLIDANYCLRDG